MKGRWPRVRAASQAAWLSLVAVFTVAYAVRHGRAFAALDVSWSAWGWATGFLGILAAKVAISLMVHRAWTAAGAEMTPGAAAYAYNLSQLPKYVPGGVWPYLNRVHLARGRDVAMPRIWGGLALETALLLGGALALAALAVDPAALAPALGRDGAMEAWLPAARVAVGVGLAVAWGVVWARSRRRRAWVEATLLAGVAWLCLGVSFQQVVAAAAPATPALAVAGLFALAWAVGFVAVFSPAGVGVREVILAAGLAGVGPAPLVAAVVVGHRLLYVAADILCAVAARALFPPEPPA